MYIHINLKSCQTNDILFMLESNHIYIHVNLKSSQTNDILFMLESILRINIHANYQVRFEIQSS